MLAVEQLGELVDEMAFVGGCATGLLITDPAAPPIRVTRDVDAIVQQAKEESERLVQELNAAARRNLLTKERERRRLAAELHDEFGQTLTALQTRLMLIAPQLGPAGQGAAVDSLLDADPGNARQHLRRA